MHHPLPFPRRAVASASQPARTPTRTRGLTVGMTLSLSALLLSACGGGGSEPAAVSTGSGSSLVNGTAAGTSTATTTAGTLQVSGRVLNVGYLGATQVCLDTDDDGACGSSEPSTTSAADGRYSLSVPTGQRGASLLAVVRPASTDSAASTDAPLAVRQGWTLSSLLEYEDNPSAVSVNISPLTTVYYARIRAAGRNRLSNQIAVFTRIVHETNVDTETGALKVPVDFDYVAAPRDGLPARLRAMHGVLDTRAATAGAPLSMLMTTALHASWYNTYTAPTTAAAGIAADATRIASFASTSTSSAEYYIAQDYHYFRPHSPAALRLREGLTETAGFVRQTGSHVLSYLDRRGTELDNGSIVYRLARWAAGVWTTLVVEETPSITLNASGTAVLQGSTDHLKARTITAIDGNRVTFTSPHGSARFGFDIADSPGTNFFINEWVDEQGSYSVFYNGTAPATATVSAAPSACNRIYQRTASGVVNTASANNTSSTTGLGTGTTASTWYATCFDYYLAEYYDLVKGDLGLTYQNTALPGANFYDATLRGSLLSAPARSTCVNPSPNAVDAIPSDRRLASVTTLGASHCNWALDTAGGHTVADLFRTDGVAINSWSKYYGTTSFTTGGVTTARTAGTAEQAGLPQQLTLKLVRDGNATSGSGTLTSPYGAWTATSYTETTETIRWKISDENPNLVLVWWPFRDSGDPRVKSGLASDGSTSPTAPVLPAGQFGGATLDGNTFSAAPATHTAPNYRKLALMVVDGHIVSGQYYGSGYTYTERYFTVPAMEQGMAALEYIFGKLRSAGFTD